MISKERKSQTLKQFQLLPGVCFLYYIVAAARFNSRRDWLSPETCPLPRQWAWWLRLSVWSHSQQQQATFNSALHLFANFSQTLAAHREKNKSLKQCKHTGQCANSISSHCSFRILRISQISLDNLQYQIPRSNLKMHWFVAVTREAEGTTYHGSEKWLNNWELCQ